MRELRPGDSPRLTGESAEHAAVLAEVAGELPPILVHRPTMRVVDGAHRIRAAKLRGQEKIEVQFVDCTEAEMFVRAVRANMTHGLPLSRADREAAAARVINYYPLWSDPIVAEVTGLAAGTVAAIRKRNGARRRGAVRIGRDGRTRPLDQAKGRISASKFLARRPDASLREVAKEAGISPATARDVRARMRRGEDPVPPGRGRGDKRASAGRIADQRPEPDPPEPAADVGSVLEQLRNDPSVRYKDSGRTFWRWLYPRVTGLGEWAGVVAAVPPHCRHAVAGLARRCAYEWLALAERLEGMNETDR